MEGKSEQINKGRKTEEKDRRKERVNALSKEERLRGRKK